MKDVLSVPGERKLSLMGSQSQEFSVWTELFNSYFSLFLYYLIAFFVPFKVLKKSFLEEVSTGLPTSVFIPWKHKLDMNDC